MGLNTRLKGALQWNCSLLTRALLGSDRRAAARSMLRSGLEGHACPAAASERTPAPHGSDRMEDVMLHGPLLVRRMLTLGLRVIYPYR